MTFWALAIAVFLGALAAGLVLVGVTAFVLWMLGF